MSMVPKPTTARLPRSRTHHSNSALKPGAYFEQHEPSLFFYSDLTSFPEDHAYTQWGHFMLDAGGKAGMRFDICDKIKGWMEEAGFVNVTEFRMPWLVGPWSKDKHQREVGQWNQLRLDLGIADFCSRRFSNQMGVSIRCETLSSADAVEC